MHGNMPSPSDLTATSPGLSWPLNFSMKYWDFTKPSLLMCLFIRVAKTVFEVCQRDAVASSFTADPPHSFEGAESYWSYVRRVADFCCVQPKVVFLSNRSLGGSGGWCGDHVSIIVTRDHHSNV